MISRSIKHEIAYKTYRRKQAGECGFCQAYAESGEQVVKIYNSMMILRNKFPYVRWDGWRVGEHLMIVPIRHSTTLRELSIEEEDDFMTLMAEYDEAGYSFYHRSHGNKSKSMPHIHGHLIKPREARA